MVHITSARYITSIEIDIANLIDHSGSSKKFLLIHEENIKFIEEFLERDSIFVYYNNMRLLDLTKITEEDISILEEYLDCLCMIEG